MQRFFLFLHASSVTCHAFVTSDSQCSLTNDVQASTDTPPTEMAFAEQIFTMAKQSYDKQFKDATDYAVATFKKACTNRAKAGMFFADTKPYLKQFFSQAVLNDMNEATALKIINGIKKATSRLGFKEIKITKYDGEFLNKTDPDFMRLRMSTKWDAKPAPVKLGSNVESKCPVCIETKRCVALTPCGHLMCIDCVPSVMNGQDSKCPTCRQAVIDAQCVYCS